MAQTHTHAHMHTQHLKQASWTFPQLANIFSNRKKRGVEGAGAGLAEPIGHVLRTGVEAGGLQVSWELLVRQPRQSGSSHPSLMPLNTHVPGSDPGVVCADRAIEKMPVPTAHCTSQSGPWVHLGPMFYDNSKRLVGQLTEFSPGPCEAGSA